jgi:hypothetical protein
VNEREIDVEGSEGSSPCWMLEYEQSTGLVLHTCAGEILDVVLAENKARHGAMPVRMYPMPEIRIDPGGCVFHADIVVRLEPTADRPYAVVVSADIASLAHGACCREPAPDTYPGTFLLPNDPGISVIPARHLAEIRAWLGSVEVSEVEKRVQTIIEAARRPAQGDPS